MCEFNVNEHFRLTAKTFFTIEKRIIDSGLGEDKDSFETIKKRLIEPPVLNAKEFAEECIYVILAGGFRQKIAKRKFGEIMSFINSGGEVWFPLNEEVKNLCDKMFAQIEEATGLNKGYIDVVLWKACQIGLLKFGVNV